MKINKKLLVLSQSFQISELIKGTLPDTRCQLNISTPRVKMF